MSCLYGADGSDWDSTSIPSKGALPGSPELKGFQEDANSSGSEQIEDAAPAGTPTQSAPQPRPRARMRIPQKPDSEEGASFFYPCCIS